jgi:hypothetical protein
MKDYIHTMRQQPFGVQKQFAFISALTVTLVLALIWGVSLLLSGTKTTTARGVQNQANALEAAGPIDTIISEIRSIVAPPKDPNEPTGNIKVVPDNTP